MTKPVPFFDGHNDVLLRLWRHEGADPVRAFLDGGRKGQLDLPTARRVTEVLARVLIDHADR